MVGQPESYGAVWRALADPARRQMLDLLRAKPRTTGELASEFEFSRFATMKHLKVLVAAGLVLVERRSRERVNHLNPVPIQQIHRRWIQPFEQEPADGLLRLKAIAEKSATPEDSMHTTNTQSLIVHDIRLEVRIEADPNRVWSALTEEIAHWWPKSFCVGKAKNFLLEQQVGGRMFEDWGDGQGLLWATVVTLRRGERLDIAGDSFPDFGGPGRHLTSYSLEADGTATVVKFRSSNYGALGEGAAKGLDEGWVLLVRDCFAAYAEGRPLTESPVVAR